MISIEESHIHRINGLIVIGPDLFAKDDQGMPLSPIASVFPSFRTIVAGRGIHAMQAVLMTEHLAQSVRQREHRELTAEEQEAVYNDAVALIVQDPVVIIRSDPNAMDRVFAADDILQCLLPKERIQFTGIQLPEVRRMLRRRGESWRITPAPRSTEEISHFIRSSRVHVSTGATYYQNAHTGGRFLTSEEFSRIRPLIGSDRREAIARLKEILSLSQLFNNEGARELSLFLPSDRSLPLHPLNDIISALERADSPGAAEEAERLFDRYAKWFADTAGAELASDGEDRSVWRTTMFCRLFGIHEQEIEEWVLGLSPEFHLNVRWLPGARIAAGELHFEPGASIRVRNLISHYWHNWEGLLAINVGRVESPQTKRDRTGEEREVYLIVLELSDGTENIRLVRMMKWDIIHRLKLGTHRDQAIGETFQYRDYILDRLMAAKELGIAIPVYTEIRLEEELPGLGVIPVFFFDRQYVPGIVTDKIPPARYGQPGFIVRLAGLLGQAATVSLILGRVCPRTGHVFFDDADEVIQFNGEGLPERLILAETTGSFTDWFTRAADILPHCLWHFSRHLAKARDQGIPHSELHAAVTAFADAVLAEVERMRERLTAHPSLRNLFAGRSTEPGSIRCRWEGILNRLESTNTEELRRLILDDPAMSPYRDEG